jgi:SAM-dependent methyltransferase
MPKAHESRRARPWRIAVLSALVLILELAFIRQIPAQVRVISYFANLILMASFFGLGLGAILQRQRTLSVFFPVGVAAVFAFILMGRGIAIYDDAKVVHYWLVYSELEGRAWQLPLLPAAAAAFIAAAMPFVALGQALARTMDTELRLVAYAWDIFGSLLGTVLFFLSSLVGIPPWAWVPVVAVGWALFFETRIGGKSSAIVCGCAFLAFSSSPQAWRWSPYYFVESVAEPDGLRVFVNSSFHQLALDFTPTGDAALQTHMMGKWGRPYEVYRRFHDGRAPRNVLVLGAGTGNDVHVALANGVDRVVAVEIDPVILELGRTENVSKPYADPRVDSRVDDARHFLRTCEEQFDMIVFGTLDSQTLLSGHANLRLENYVYTREALSDARRRLAERGVLAVYYSVFRPWLYGRIYSTVRAAFGDQAQLYRESSEFLFNTLVVAGKNLPELANTPDDIRRFGTDVASEDDWPFIYLERRTIAPIYRHLCLLVLLLVGAAFLLLRAVHPVTGLHADFLFLGIGFSLMESAAVVRLSLLFGSTWTVNAVVFSAVLLTIFCANLMVLKAAAPRLEFAWAGLAASILLNYGSSPGLLLVLATPFRVLGAAMLIGLPIFFAAVCFSRLFAAEKITGYPLGLNLIGAMAGGLVEYISMLTGMRAVWLIVLVLYLCAWLSNQHVRGRVTTA